MILKLKINERIRMSMNKCAWSMKSVRCILCSLNTKYGILNGTLDTKINVFNVNDILPLAIETNDD